MYSFRAALLELERRAYNILRGRAKENGTKERRVL